jgi:phage gpG-like protein
MPVRFSFEVQGEKQFDRIFQRFDEDLRDITPIADEIRDAFWEIEKEQFQSGGAKGASGKWKPLSPAYERQKIAQYGTFAIIAGVLRATDAMYKSMTSQTGDTVYQKSKDSIVIGTSLARAMYHQTGGGRLPQRKVIDFSDDQRRSLTKEIQKSLVKQIRRGGIYVDYSGDVF